MQKTEARRVVWRHPKGIYETVEVSGTGVFGVPYSYRETVYPPERDARGLAHKADDAAPARPARIPSALSARDEQEICKMYTKDFIPIANIAACKHCAPVTIKTILAKHNIAVRKSGPRPKAI